MKLLAAASILAKFSSSTSLPPFESTCTDTGFLEIRIPYASEATSSLLALSTGSCSESGASSANHDYYYNSTTQQGVLSINIANCGLNNALYETPYLPRSNYYMATAEVTLGAVDANNGQELIFYHAKLGAECGERTDYTVTFNYREQITFNQTCDVNGPNGECITAAYDAYNFQIREFTDDSYSTVEADDAIHQANTMIYLQDGF